MYDFSFAAGDVVAIGFTGRAWIEPISGSWNISTTFSLVIRNDTGRINSTPRAITSPVIRLQEGCNHTIALAVNDPDGDIVRCRWAQGRECAGSCNDHAFPGAELHSNTCVIEYQANMEARYWAAAIMIEDFIPESPMPLSSVALQFLVLVISSTESCSQKPVFVQPTIRHGSCVAIPPEATFATQLIANGGGSDISIVEIQTVPPFGTRVGELTQISDSNSYYVNVTWTPDYNQQNQTHLFCFTAVGSDRLASDQTCIDLLPGYFPPAPIQATALPNQQLVHPSNTTWRVMFDTEIERSSVTAYITFHEYNTEEEVYSIDASQSQEVTFEQPNEISITPGFFFTEKTKFYITLEREVVQGLEQCRPGNAPVSDKNFWTFETMDVTPPPISFIENATVTNANVSFSWESNENATWECILMQGTTETAVNCSESYWRGYGLSEGVYYLEVRATDNVGNTATVTHTFEVDLTPPIAVIIEKPRLVSNEETSTLVFSCNESPCSYECHFRSSMMAQEILSPCYGGVFVTPILQTDTNYTLLVRAIDQVGNTGEGVSYTWETDFEDPSIFGVQNTSTMCNHISPEYAGQAQAVDSRPENISLRYDDVHMGCSIRRTWTATDNAGNVAQLTQNISLEFSPTVSLSPQVALPCDRAAILYQVSNSTAYAPNPCGLPLQLTYQDSEYMCPGDFVRNWTVNSCGSSATVSQTIFLYDLCPSYACGNNESTPRGMCSLGECQCNRPWHGEDCDTIIHEPIAEPVNDTSLQEGQEYTSTVAVTQGSPPLSWTLISGPEQLTVDQYTGQVTWSRAQAGNHSITVQIENQVGRTQVVWSLQVIPGYSAFLSSVSPALLPHAQPVVLTGYVQFAANNLLEEHLSGIVPVHIDIISNGATRTVKTYTISNGSFSLTFYPTSTEYGTYTAGARHPSSIQLLSQVEWGILGMKSVPSQIVLKGEAVSEIDDTFYNATVIHNDGPGSLNGLTATPILPNTRDITVEILLKGSISNGTLEPGDQLVMDIRVVASRILNGLFLVVLETSEGTTLQVLVSLQIEPVLPTFLIDPPMLDTRTIQGRSRIFEFNITNTGRAAANNVRSIVPDTDFISFISFGNARQSEGNLRLESGESAMLSILIQTPLNQWLGEIDATIVIASSKVSLALPIALTVASNTLMNLTVVVEDEYTYFATGRPLVSNAVVTLINYQRNVRVTQTTDTGSGAINFIDIYEDRYEISVEAPRHQTLRQIIVTSIENPVVTVFIERQAVIYTWSVTPTTYEDIYTISVVADFETRVPLPVVTVTPNEIDLDELEAGLITSIQLNITNHGLIRADNVGIQLPNNHPLLEFSTGTEVVGDLEPLSSVIITIHSSRRSIQKRNLFNRLGSGVANAVNWAIYLIDVVYSYVCNEPQFRRAPVVLKQQTICNNQLSQPVVGTLDYRTHRNRGGRAYYSPGNPVYSGNPRDVLYLGEIGSFDVDIRSFSSFNGYSTETPFFCNPCVSTALGCLAPSTFELLLRVPLSGCIPLILMGSNPISSVTNAVDWLQCTVGNPLTGFAICAHRNNLFDNCLGSSTTSRSKRNLRRSLTELIEALYPIQQSIALGIEILGDELWVLLGDPQWLSHVLRPALDDASEAGVLISTNELSTILAAPPPNGTTIEMVARMAERINNTLYGWNNGQLEPHQGDNIASFSIVQELNQNINIYNELAKGKGFSSYLDAYNFASGEVNQISNLEEEAGVCAVVRIRIEQELALTREAFLARLEIENQEDSPLEQIDVEIIITDLITGGQATHLFSIGNGTLSGSLSSGISGKWLLPNEMSGSVEWLIIPYSEAAPESDHVYNVGGSFNYLLNGDNISVPLLPTPITVRPDPSLLVHYFWERYVVGDDPFTDDVEPSIPFTLGVAVKNAGYGTAQSVKISSGQPEIIDNERGLLINFMIVGANIGGESISPSLTVMFGDLAPNTTTVARWYMISSLQGEFMSYSATFENMNLLGDPKLSVLDELEIHELIRNVKIYNSNEDDGIPDFLVNDQNDYLAYPDTLYSSKTLQQYNVSVGTILSLHTTSDNMATSLVVRTLTNSTGWVYYRYEDIQGILSSSASSVNGTKQEGNQTIELPPENTWITRDRDSNSETETFYLHIVDYVETTDEVIFTLDPCTVNCPTLELPFTRPTVKRKNRCIALSVHYAYNVMFSM